ncbi:MAG TPA: hypothetical protein VKE74_18285, partial [Gemmataceae bacterium]|nr:hypothetical protein [Gemmataceae bacterium]
IAEGESVLVTESAELDTEEGDEADEGDPEGTGEVQPGEGQPGTGRKRRRRRRRRKKGGSGAPQPAAEAQEPAGAIDETQEGAEEDEVTAEVTADRVSDVDEEAEEIEEVESAGVPLAAEEDTGSEVLRDLIANWNVPSWDDIVAGLYRPER